MFYFAEQVRGATKLQKPLFLIEQETEFFEEYEDNVAFEFAPYHRGPSSDKVYSKFEFLLQLSAIEPGPMKELAGTNILDSALGSKTFRITPNGEKITEQLQAYQR